MNPVLFVFGLVQLAFLVVIAYYLVKLKQTACECALMKPYAILSQTVWFLMAFRVFLLVVEVAAADAKRLLTPLVVFMTLINLAFFLASITFIVNLYKIQCDCSKNALQMIYLIYAIFKVAWIVFIYMTLALIYLRFR